MAYPGSFGAQPMQYIQTQRGPTPVMVVPQQQGVYPGQSVYAPRVVATTPGQQLPPQLQTIRPAVTNYPPQTFSTAQGQRPPGPIVFSPTQGSGPAHLQTQRGVVQPALQTIQHTNPMATTQRQQLVMRQVNPPPAPIVSGFVVHPNSTATATTGSTTTTSDQEKDIVLLPSFDNLVPSTTANPIMVRQNFALNSRRQLSGFFRLNFNKFFRRCNGLPFLTQNDNKCN